MGNAFAMTKNTAAPIEYERVRSSPFTFRRYRTAPQRGQRAFPPGGRGISRWSRSQSWQACRWDPGTRGLYLESDGKATEIAALGMGMLNLRSGDGSGRTSAPRRRVR